MGIVTPKTIRDASKMEGRRPSTPEALPYRRFSASLGEKKEGSSQGEAISNDGTGE